jgi:hypothetical protein
MGVIVEEKEMKTCEMFGDDVDNHCYFVEGNDEECFGGCPTHTVSGQGSPWTCNIIECDVCDIDFK